MRAPFAASVVLVLVIAGVPLAAAGTFEAVCVTSACVWEMDYSTGECPGDGMTLRETDVRAAPLDGVEVFVFGFDYCYGGETTTQAEGVQIGATPAYLAWYTVDAGEGEHCFFELRGAVPLSRECPQGDAPPNPGWGRLLP